MTKPAKTDIRIPKDLQYYKFCAYGLLKNIRLFEAFLVLFFLEVGLNYVEIGMLLGIRGLTTQILEIPTGMVADGFGRRKSLILSFISYILSFAVFTIVSGFYYYCIAMVLFAFGEAFRTGTHKAMILTYLEMKGIKHLKVYYYGLTRSASQIGSALSSILAAVLVFYQGSYRWVFLVSIVPYVLELFLIISYPKELDGHIQRFTGGFRQAIWYQFTSTGKDFVAIFRVLPTLRSLLTASVFSGLYDGSKDYLQPLIKQYALVLPFLMMAPPVKRTALLVGAVYFILFLLTAYASRKSGHFTDHLKSLPHALNHTFLAGILCLILAGAALHMEWYFIAIVLFSSIYLLENLRRPICVGYISEKIDSHIMATGLSGESILNSAFAALFSFVMGVVVEYGGLSTGILSLSLLCLLIYPLARIKPEAKAFQ